jgi:hypothetical protein
VGGNWCFLRRGNTCRGKASRRAKTLAFAIAIVTLASDVAFLAGQGIRRGAAEDKRGLFTS